jgi:hypothetical protein
VQLQFMPPALQQCESPSDVRLSRPSNALAVPRSLQLPFPLVKLHAGVH